MADRWSNPSGPLGINRFRVWPAGSDSYDHTEQTVNWDTLDGLLGVPSLGTWPPSTGVNGGIYKEIKLLQLERAPIGACMPWVRPLDAIDIPAGWVPLDGRTLQPSEHEFPGVAGSVLLPNLVNAFVLGASPDKTAQQTAVGVGSGEIDAANGAPGPQGVGGTNQVVLTTGQLASHAHPHSHSFNRQVKRIPRDFFDPADANYIINVRDEITHTEVTASDSTLAGSGLPHENRPRFVGLIWICKVKYVATLA